MRTILEWLGVYKCWECGSWHASGDWMFCPLCCERLTAWMDEYEEQELVEDE